jgi:hypothetical protein
MNPELAWMVAIFWMAGVRGVDGFGILVRTALDFGASLDEVVGQKSAGRMVTVGTE